MAADMVMERMWIMVAVLTKPVLFRNSLHPAKPIWSAKLVQILSETVSQASVGDFAATPMIAKRTRSAKAAFVSRLLIVCL